MTETAAKAAYIRHGNIYIVPIIHCRLNFAVLVQRAARQVILHDMEMRHARGEQHDLSNYLIAVALPESIRAKVQEALLEYPKAPPLTATTRDRNKTLKPAQLPKVSLITSELSADDYREVFPISPCDGAIEAVRISNENHIPLRFIDRNIVPAHLSLRSCMYDPKWPDDGMVLSLGAERYLQLIQENISQPPNRTDPVDAWRECHITEKLQLLEPKFRRILFVCDAKLVGNIRRLLETPSLRLADQGNEQPELSVKDLVKPKLDIIQQYLDDFPKLTEIYERERFLGKAADFDKWDALIDAICQGGKQPIDLRASARKYRIVFTFLKNLLENDCRVVPTPSQVFEVFTSCFNREFAQKIHYHLGAYHPQIEAKKIRGFDLEQYNLLAFHPSSQDGREIFTARFCIPSPRAYWPEEGITIIDEDFDSSRRFLWPPTKKLMNRLRRVVYEAARERSVRIRVEKFSGSMHSGIDSKRTLRSYYRGAPSIYVKEQRRLPRATDVKGEPILWLIDSNAGPGCEFDHSMFGLEGGSQFDLWLDYSLVSQSETEYENVDRLYSYKVYGRLGFADAYTKLTDVRRFYGDEFNNRIPKHTESQRHARNCLVKGKSWWEALLLTGLKYAKKSLICVSADSFQIPGDIYAYAANAKKSIIQLPIRLISPDQIMKMHHFYSIDSTMVNKNLNRSDTDDINDPAVNNYVVENFGHVLHGLPHVTWEW